MIQLYFRPSTSRICVCHHLWLSVNWLQNESSNFEIFFALLNICLDEKLKKFSKRWFCENTSQNVKIISANSLREWNLFILYFSGVLNTWFPSITHLVSTSEAYKTHTSVYIYSPFSHSSLRNPVMFTAIIPFLYR